MLLSLLALKTQLDNSENFSSSEESQYEAGRMVGNILLVVFYIIFCYGAARLSYFYNMNNGNSGYAILWSILAFIFADVYYPMYSFFLNPQSAKGRNNIPMPSSM